MVHSPHIDRLLSWLSGFWKAVQPDPYFHIASLMELEGYSEREIDAEIYRLKVANGDLDPDDPQA